MQGLFEVVKRLDVGVHSFFLRIGDEHHAVDAFEDQLARRVVKNLTGHGVQVKARFESADGAELERHEVEKQRAICFRGKADQLAARLRGGGIEDVLQVRRLATQARAVVDDLAVDFSGSVVNKGHSACRQVKRLSISSSVMPAKGESRSSSSVAAISSNIAASCCETCLARSFTSPRLDRSSKTTTSNNLPTTEMSRHSFPPSRGR